MLFRISVQLDIRQFKSDLTLNKGRKTLFLHFVFILSYACTQSNDKNHCHESYCPWWYVYIIIIIKGAVSRNSAKLGNYKMLVKLRET